IKIKYGWFMVGIGAFMTCIAIGAMFSLAVFLQPITQATGWSHTEVSSAMTIGFLAMGAAGFGWGALSDRIGPRYVVLAGAVLLGLGLFLASRAQSALQFQLAFGLLVGIAIGSFFTPMIAAVMGWMTEHRGLAVSLVSVGVGVAPMTMSPFAAWLITQMDWRSAQVVLAVLVWTTLVPAALFVRRPPAAPAAGCRSTRSLRANISGSASSARCSAPPPWCPASEWRSVPRWAAGSSTASAATPGFTSVRSR